MILGGGIGGEPVSSLGVSIPQGFFICLEIHCEKQKIILAKMKMFCCGLEVLVI